MASREELDNGDVLKTSGRGNDSFLFAADSGPNSGILSSLPENNQQEQRAPEAMRRQDDVRFANDVAGLVHDVATTPASARQGSQPGGRGARYNDDELSQGALYNEFDDAEESPRRATRPTAPQSREVVTRPSQNTSSQTQFPSYNGQRPPAPAAPPPPVHSVPSYEVPPEMLHDSYPTQGNSQQRYGQVPRPQQPQQGGWGQPGYPQPGQHSQTQQGYPHARQQWGGGSGSGQQRPQDYPQQGYATGQGQPPQQQGYGSQPSQPVSPNHPPSQTSHVQNGTSFAHIPAVKAVVDGLTGLPRDSTPFTTNKWGMKGDLGKGPITPTSPSGSGKNNGAQR